MAIQNVVSVCCWKAEAFTICVALQVHIVKCFIKLFCYFKLWFLCTRSRSTWKHCERH